jgi:hypothetical protein
MANNDGRGAGDSPAPKKKRAPTARKRTAKSANAAEESAATVAEPGHPAGRSRRSDEQADGSERSPKDAGISTPRAADQADSGDERFGQTQAEGAAVVANDLKSWMDARREDRDAPREVL